MRRNCERGATQCSRSDESGRGSKVARKKMANLRRDCWAQDGTATTIAVSERVAR